MRRSTSTVRRACAVGTTIALVGLTTGLGIMTATSASALDGAPAADQQSQTVGTDAGTTDPSAPATTEPATPPTTEPAAPQTTEPAAPQTTEPAAPATGEPAAPGTTEPAAPETTEPAAPETTAPAAPTAGVTSDQPTPSLRAAAQTVTIDGDLTVGSELSAKATGFTSGSKRSYTWTDQSGATLSEDPTYTIAPELAGQQITVTVVGDVAGEQATATSDTAVAPVFVDESGQPLSDEDSDPTIEAVAGEPFSYTFRAQSTPAPVLSITWFDDEDGSETTAPKGVSFDPQTGVLSGTLTESELYYQFDVTATTTTPSGVVTSDEFGDIDVQAAAPVGIEVTSIDKDGLAAGTTTAAWIIHPNGDVYTLDLASDDEPVKGGQVTVEQGGTLLVGGTKVDRFGNQIRPDFNEETGEPIYFTPTVTSDVATDVVAADPDLGDIGFVSVMFPHASTHTLTVSGGSLPTTRFAVDVRPTIVPAVATPVRPAAAPVQHTGSGRLAYTGTDATDALPWALGFVLVGAGLIGARAMRRRRTQG